MFFKECKAILKSIIYFAFLAVVVMFYETQLGNYAGNDIKQYAAPIEEWDELLVDNPLIAPVPGQDYYGYRYVEVPEQVMPNAIAELLYEYSINEFACYSTGFYRGIKLSEKELAEIASLLTEMTGLSTNELLHRRKEKVLSSDINRLIELVDYRDAIPIIVGYDEFRENMALIDKMIGGETKYVLSNLKRYAQEAISYEEKLAEYHDFLNIDKVTGAYARLFCDYMGITIALFSVFVPVSFLLRDKRAKMNELIYSRGKSAVSIILTRYFALVCMTILPFLLLSLIPTVQLSMFAAQNNITVDYFAFIKYIITWLLPSVLTITAVAYLLTTLTDTAIAILVQFAWSFFTLMSGMYSMVGGHYGFYIIIRHNALGKVQLVQKNLDVLITNRLFYTALPLALIIVTIILYILKRRGRLNVLDSFKKNIINR